MRVAFGFILVIVAALGSVFWLFSGLSGMLWFFGGYLLVGCGLTAVFTSGRWEEVYKDPKEVALYIIFWPALVVIALVFAAQD